MKEYRVKVTVRNNLLLTAIEEAGYKSQTDFAKACDLNKNVVNALVAMRMAPIGDRGDFIEPAKQIMEVLGACPTDLWTEEQLNLSLKRNTSERYYGKQELNLAMVKADDSLLVDFNVGKNIDEKETHDRVEYYLDSLTPREAKVLRLRFGIDTDKEYKLEEIADMFNVTRERIRQIEAKALRKMRHPSRSDELAGLLCETSIQTSEERKRIREEIDRRLKKRQEEEMKELDNE